MTIPQYGVITGVVSEDSAIKPGCRVGVLDRSTFQVIDTVTADSYGVYRFDYLDPAKQYAVVAFDDDGDPKKNAVIADFVTPVESFRDYHAFVRYIEHAANEYNYCAGFSFATPDTARIPLGVGGDDHQGYRTSYTVAGDNNNDTSIVYVSGELRAVRTLLLPRSPFPVCAPPAEHGVVLNNFNVLQATDVAGFSICGHMPPGGELLVTGRIPVDAGTVPRIRISPTSLDVRLASGNGAVVTIFSGAHTVPPAFWLLVVNRGATVDLYLNGSPVATGVSVVGSSVGGWGENQDCRAWTATGGAFVTHACRANLWQPSTAQVSALWDVLTAQPAPLVRRYKQSVLALRPAMYLPMDGADPSLDVVSERVGYKRSSGTYGAGAAMTPDTAQSALFDGATWVRSTDMKSLGRAGFTVILQYTPTAINTNQLLLSWQNATGGYTAEIYQNASNRLVVDPPYSWSATVDSLALPAAGVARFVVVRVRTAVVPGSVSALPLRLTLLEVFVNGVWAVAQASNIASGSYPLVSYFDASHAWVLGGRMTGADSGNTFFTGTMAHFAAYHYALSDEQVQWLYDARTL